MAFTCGLRLSDGSECVHDSRRKALGCIERGKLVEAVNSANAEKTKALATMFEKDMASAKAEAEASTEINKLKAELEKIRSANEDLVTAGNVSATMLAEQAAACNEANTKIASMQEEIAGLKANLEVALKSAAAASSVAVELVSQSKEDIVLCSPVTP